MSLKIIGLKAATKQLASLGKQANFAAALALTRTAKVAQEEIKREIQRKVKDPTKFTLNATFIRPATKQHLVADVYLKDEAVKAIPPERWLRPLVEGGGRTHKRLEQRLIARGLLPSGWYAVPASGAQLDAYGNIGRGKIQQILSDVDAQYDLMQNATPRSRARNRRQRFFAARRGVGHLPPGIYLAQPTGLQPQMWLYFTPKQPTYARVINFYGIAEDTGREQLPLQIDMAIKHAIRTSRP